MKNLLAYTFLSLALFSWVACAASDEAPGPTGDAVADGNLDAVEGAEATPEGIVDTPIETTPDATPDVTIDTKPDTTPGDEGTVNPDAEVPAPDAEIPSPDAEIPPPDVTDVPAEVCVPDCTGNKICGDDGCQGLCGTCDDPTKPVCAVDQLSCVAIACDLPATWGKAGVVATMESPGTADATFIKEQCPDFSGDGNGDNGLKSLASTINPELKKALDGGTIGIIFEFKDVTNFTDTASFQLVGLIGEPEAAGSNNYLLDQMSYKIDTPNGECLPLISFEGAKITASALAAGPSEFVLSIPVEALGGILAFTLQKAQIKATLTDDGVNATGGVIAGVLTKEQVDATLAKIKANCAVNPTDICDYIGTAEAFLPMLFDLDENKDGKKDAASICMKFTLKGGTVTGYKAP